MNASEIISVLKSEIADFDRKTGVQEGGTVVRVGDGIATVYGMQHAMYGELVEFETGVRGIIQNLEEKTVGVVLLGLVVVVFQYLFQIFFIVQADVPALHSVRASEGNIFSLVRPCDFVAEPLHLPYKIRTAAAAVHHKINIGHQLELPAVALRRGTVLTA